MLVLAREDALRLRRLVSSTHARRQNAASSKNGPEPSQRSIDSLGTVCPLPNHSWFPLLISRHPGYSVAHQFCRKRHDVPTCCKRTLRRDCGFEICVDVRPESICRYFGDIIDTTDDVVMESVCDKMCDVGSLLINRHVLVGKSTVYDVHHIIQVCKHPDKTRQRKMNLSDEDYAATAISRSAWNVGYEEDEESEGPKPQQQQRAPVSAGGNENPTNAGQQTLWDCLNPPPVQGFKRPTAHGRDKLVLPNSKRAKVEHAKDERTATGAGLSNSARTSTSACASMPRPLGKPAARVA